MRFARDTEDLTGKVFSKWTVLRYDKEGSARKTRWIVRCSCGTESSLSSTELRTGRSRFCRKCMGMDDLTGKILGSRVVLRVATVGEYKGSGRAKMWLVRCSCGKEEFVRGSQLREGVGEKCTTCASVTHGLLAGVPPGPKRLRSYHLVTKHGITVETYNNILSSQDGKCAICRKKFDKRLNVDHCHITMKIRGLLCHKCNIAIGMFEDNTKRLKAAIQYLDHGGFDVSQLWRSEDGLRPKRIPRNSKRVKINGKEEIHKGNTCRIGEDSACQDSGLQMQFLHALGNSEMQGRVHTPAL